MQDAKKKYGKKKADLLLKLHTLLGVKHEDGFTPLHRACWGREARHTETVRVLLKAGAPPDDVGPDARSMVEMASGNPATQKLLRHRLMKMAEKAMEGRGDKFEL